MTTADKRKFRRFVIATPALVQFTDSQGRRVVVRLKSRNISSSGTLLDECRKLRGGVMVRLKLSLVIKRLSRLRRPGRLAIRTCGSVVRSDERGTAVQFLGESRISPESEEATLKEAKPAAIAAKR